MKKNLCVLLSMSTLILMGSACSKSAGTSAGATTSTSTTSATPAPAVDLSMMDGKSFVEKDDCKLLKDHARYKKENGAVKSVYGAHIQRFLSTSEGVGMIDRRLSFFSDSLCEKFLFTESYSSILFNYEFLGANATKEEGILKISNNAGSVMVVSISVKNSDIIFPNLLTDFGKLSTDITKPSVITSGTKVNEFKMGAQPDLDNDVDGSYEGIITNTDGSKITINLYIGSSNQAVTDAADGITFNWIETTWTSKNGDDTFDAGDEIYWQRMAKGKFFVSGTGLIKNGARQFEIDVIGKQKITMNPYSKFAADFMNQAQYCSIDTWKEFKTEDVTSASCETKDGVNPKDIKLYVEQGDATEIKVSGYFHGCTGVTDAIVLKKK